MPQTCSGFFHCDRWPYGLRRRSTAAWLLWSRVRVPLRSWMLIFSVWCFVQVAASTRSWTLFQGSLNARARVCVCLIVRYRNLNNEAAWAPLGLLYHRKKIYKRSVEWAVNNSVRHKKFSCWFQLTALQKF